MTKPALKPHTATPNHYFVTFANGRTGEVWKSTTGYDEWEWVLEGAESCAINRTGGLGYAVERMEIAALRGTFELAEALPVTAEAALEMDRADRNVFTKELRRVLKARTGRAWSVKGGRGTGYSWITVSAPPSRCARPHQMTAEDQALLADVLGDDSAAHRQGFQIPPCRGHRAHALLFAATGQADGVTPEAPAWD